MTGSIPNAVSNSGLNREPTTAAAFSVRLAAGLSRSTRNADRCRCAANEKAPAEAGAFE